MEHGFEHMMSLEEHDRKRRRIRKRCGMEVLLWNRNCPDSPTSFVRSYRRNMSESLRLFQGDALTILKTLPDESAQMIVTSPPYWHLRNYKIDGQIGQEETPDAYIARLVEVFREVRRVLRDDGCLWLNLGDCYSAGGRGAWLGFQEEMGEPLPPQKPPPGFKPKDLLMLPARVAMALQADGWYLRSQMPWIKRNAMPDNVKDRPASAVEYIFLLSKNEHYFYDHIAIQVPAKVTTKWPGIGPQHAQERERNEKYEPMTVNKGRNRRNTDWFWESWQGLYDEGDGPLGMIVNPSGYKDAHFAVFPEKLVEPCIKAGTSEYGACSVCNAPWKRIESSWKSTCACSPTNIVPCTVLDPFMGSGTTGLVSLRLNRHFIGIDLNSDYIEMARRRINKSGHTSKLQNFV